MEKLKEEYYYGLEYEQGTNIVNKPRIAKIDYDEFGNILSADFSDLDNYIEKVIIKSNISFKNGKYTLILSDILKYISNDVEIWYTINYLKEKDIIIVGINSSLECLDFSNYQSVHDRDYIMKNLEKVKYTDNDELFRLYHATKDKELKKQIFINNIKLVKKVIFLGHYERYDEDLNEYGYIGLLEAIDKYDIRKNIAFSTFASQIIKYKIMYYLTHPDDSRKNENTLLTYQKCLYKFEQENGLVDILDENMREEILTKMFENDYLREYEKEFDIRTFINMNNSLSFEQLDEQNINEWSYSNIKNDFTEDLVNKKIIEEAIEQLDERKREMVKLKFGFYNNYVYNYGEIGKVFGVSREWVRQIVIQSLEELRDIILGKTANKEVLKRKRGI